MGMCRFVALATITAAVGCRPGAVASSLLSTPEYASGQPRCSVQKSADEPLIVEWAPTDRAKLEALSRQGLVMIHYQGCEMRVLADCTVPRSSYRYVATTVKQDSVSIRNADDLYAKLPFGAARLEATLERTGELDVDMRIVGRYQADRSDIRAADLAGRCAEATHAVTAVIVGAFDFSTAATANVGGEASVFDAGVGAGSRAARDTLSRDGELAACGVAQLTDTAPPPNCGALLRLEVTPLPEVEERRAAEAAAREEQREADDARAAGWRALGWSALGVGVAAGSLAALFAYLSAQANDDIAAGGFATSAEIEAAEADGSTYNVAAWTLAATGVALGATGVAIVLANPSPAPGGDSAQLLPLGVAIRGRLW
jgi:hypothetical protein